MPPSLRPSSPFPVFYSDNTLKLYFSDVFYLLFSISWKFDSCFFIYQLKFFYQHIFWQFLILWLFCFYFKRPLTPYIRFVEGAVNLKSCTISSDRRNISTDNELFWSVFRGKLRDVYYEVLMSVKRSVPFYTQREYNPADSLMERQHDSIFINGNANSFWPRATHKDKDVYSGVWGCIKSETVTNGHKSRSEKDRGEELSGNVQPLCLKTWELFYLLQRESDLDP